MVLKLRDQAADRLDLLVTDAVNGSYLPVLRAVERKQIRIAGFLQGRHADPRL